MSGWGKLIVPGTFRPFRTIAIAFCALGILTLAGLGTAQARTHGMIVLDGDTGRVIQAMNADVPNHPASLTKIMTLYLLFDALESGKVHLHDPMPVSMHAARQEPSKLGLNPGQTIEVEQAILGLVTKSANDAAVVIAEYLGGTEADFATRMSKKARELGMTRTEFRNASGLPIAGQWSTPRDMATLARALIRNHGREYHYFSTREFDYAGQTIPSHNHLLGSYPGADGIKTGYIASAGFNLVASAKRDGHRIIGVVFGGDSVRARDRQMVALLDTGFAHIQGAPVPNDVVAMSQGQDDAAANAPASEDEADAQDPQVNAVMQALAESKPAAAQAAAAEPQQVEGAGDADESPWGIRLGAFAQRQKAERVVTVAFQKLGDLVSDGHSQVTATKLHHHRAMLYRADLVGLEEASAQRACKTLKHHGASCTVIHVQPG